MNRISAGRRAFLIANNVFLGSLAMLCVFPLIHVLAISFSSNTAVTGGLVILWPVGFTTKSYAYILQKPELLTALLVSVKRVALGVPIYLSMTVLTAYPLSKSVRDFKQSKAYTWVFVVTMLFGGGLIPYYMTIKTTGLIDSIWALVIPGCVPVYYVILMMNFFRGLPRELEEAAFIDGAGHLTTLLKVYIPLSLPSLATITLFCTVDHWNSWFDGIIFMNSTSKYPLQSYLQTIIVTPMLKITSTNFKDLAEINDRTSKAAQIFITTVPVLAVYPFLQKYFMKGLVLGSVKG